MAHTTYKGRRISQIKNRCRQFGFVVKWHPTDDGEGSLQVDFKKILVKYPDIDIQKHFGSWYAISCIDYLHKCNLKAIESITYQFQASAAVIRYLNSVETGTD